MAKKREKKEKAKAEQFEDRVEALEKQLKIMQDKTDLSAYNYLVRQIMNTGKQTQEFVKSIQLQQEFIAEKELTEEFQAWVEAKFKAMQEEADKKSLAMQQPPKPKEQPKTDVDKKLADDKGLIQHAQKTQIKPDVCPACDGRGYIGDNEECPQCHPNKE